MRTTVKFPALMVALPPRHKNPKIALGVFDTTVELREVDDREFPVAISCENRGETLQWRFMDGKLYRHSGKWADRILKSHADNLLSPKDWNRTTGAIIREMDRAVKDISDYSEDTFWPAGVKRILSAGINSEYAEFNQIVSESPSLRLSGPWLATVAEKKPEMVPLLAEAQEERVARYERMMKDVFASMRSLDGAIWMPAAEPCFVAQTMPEGYGRCMTSDFGRYAVTSDNDEDRRSWWNDIGDRAISITERDHVIENMPCFNKELPSFTVAIPEALSADIPALELDRCARVLVNKVAENAAKRSKEFCLPSTATIEAFTALTALTRSYDPLENVPEELEDSVQALLTAVGACEDDKHLISDRDRGFAAGYIERWSDRVVDFDMAAEMKP